VPGLYFLIGGMPAGMNPIDASQHHTPDFYVEDKSILLGVRTMSYLALDYLTQHAKK